MRGVKLITKLVGSKQLSSTSRLSRYRMAGPFGTSEPVTNSFQNLIGALSKALGPSSGLDSGDVNAREIERLMENYASNEAEWLKFALGDMRQSYTRNLVDDGNGKSNLVSTYDTTMSTRS